MKRNNKWLQKQEIARQKYIQAASETFTQYAADCTMSVLHDKYGFGPNRLSNFGQSLREYMSEFSPALDISSDECGYTQECLDRKLKEALNEYFEAPFEERYPWLKGVDI